MAGGDDAAVDVAVLLDAVDGLAGDESGQQRRGLLPAGPACAAALAGLRFLGRVDAVEADALTGHHQRIAVDRGGGTGEQLCGRRSGREQRENWEEEAHRASLARKG